VVQFSGSTIVDRVIAGVGDPYNAALDASVAIEESYEIFQPGIVRELQQAVETGA
jgi:hypothetical protein